MGVGVVANVCEGLYSLWAEVFEMEFAYGIRSCCW